MVTGGEDFPKSGNESLLASREKEDYEGKKDKMMAKTNKGGHNQSSMGSHATVVRHSTLD